MKKPSRLSFSPMSLQSCSPFHPQTTFLLHVSFFSRILPPFTHSPPSLFLFPVNDLCPTFCVSLPLSLGCDRRGVWWWSFTKFMNRAVAEMLHGRVAHIVRRKSYSGGVTELSEARRWYDALRGFSWAMWFAAVLRLLLLARRNSWKRRSCPCVAANPFPSSPFGICGCFMFWS